MTRVLHKLDDKNVTAKFVIVRVKKGDNVMLKVFDGDLQLTVSVMFTLERSLWKIFTAERNHIFAKLMIGV